MFGSSLVIATAQLMRFDIGGSFKYEAEQWIDALVAEAGYNRTKHPHPMPIASAVYEKLRRTFQGAPVAAWENQGAGKRVVTYIVAGYPKQSTQPQIVEVAVEVNSDGTGLRFVAPRRHPVALGQVFTLGEDSWQEEWRRNPEDSGFDGDTGTISGWIALGHPELPPALSEIGGFAAAAVRLQSKIEPKRVGRQVFLAIIDRSHECTYDLLIEPERLQSVARQG